MPNLFSYISTVLFQTIQFSISTQNCFLTLKLFQIIYFSVVSLVQFDPHTGPYQDIQLQVRVNLEAMEMKRCSAFPKAQSLLKPHNQVFSVISRTLVGEGSLNPRQRFSLCSTAPSQLSGPSAKVWFGWWVLWHINLCRLFNAKSIFM